MLPITVLEPANPELIIHANYHAQQTMDRLGQSGTDVSKLCENGIEPE